MSRLVSTFAALLRLRAGPQDFPASWYVTTGIIALYLAQGVFTGQQLGDENAAAKSLAIATVQFSAVAALLYFRKYPNRLAQTLSALAGAGAFLGFLAYLIVSQADPARNQPLLAFAWFGIFLWSLVVDAHIYRHALSVSMPQGVLVAVLMLAAGYSIIEALF